jgi:hypothetical protein
MMFKLNFKKLIYICIFSFAANSFGTERQQAGHDPKNLVSPDYVIFDEIVGDLNKDGFQDYIYIIKGTDKNRVIYDEYRGNLDRNRRGIVIIFGREDLYELVLENVELFSSEHEDGGVYAPPDLGVFIEKGVIRIHYFGGRYGFWSYKFRYQHSDFELIGYDSSSNHGPIVLSKTSINFLTKNILFKENIHPERYDGKERFMETWKKFMLPKSIKLSEIEDMDDLDVTSYLKIVN